MPQLKRILLVRHGQTDWNIAGRWQGTLQIPLNAEGQAQAQALAQHLRGSAISAIYSSDLARALQTAEAIGAAVGVQPQSDQRWREFRLGIFQGLTDDEIIEQYPDEWHQFRENYWDYVVPQGESRRALQERLYTAWLDITARDHDGAIIIVSHGGAIKMLLLKLFDGNAELSNIHIENTSVTIVEGAEDQWHLTSIARIDHL